MIKTTEKNIVITGASKGLGRELAKRLSQRNHNLILVARNRAELESVQNEIQTQTRKTPLIIVCDVTNEEDVKKMANIIRERYSHIDVLVNNAGIGVSKTLEKISNDEMRRQFETNVFGVFNCTKALISALKNSPAGYILNVGSLLGKVSFAQTSVYSATKFALDGFTQGFRNEIRGGNIKVGHFMPGPMNTSFREESGGDSIKVPVLLIINPQRAAKVIEKMIIHRKRSVYMYRWILWVMKVKKLAETFH